MKEMMNIMNFAIPFTTKFNHWDQKNTEININYKPKIKELQDFILRYPQKRINLIFNRWDDFQKQRDPALIQALRKKYPTCNLVMRLPSYSGQIQDILSEKQLPHYYYILADKWDIFNGLLEKNITDIYIVEDLCFFMDKIKAKKEEKGIHIRTFCNICQKSWQETNPLQTFFIRPEDISLYEGYIDTIEFFNAIQNKSALNILYDLYNNKQRWTGPLNEIIQGFDIDVNSTYIVPSFGERRLNCEKRCNFSLCSFCSNISELAKILEERQIGIIYKKENFQYNKEDGKNEKSEDTN